MCCWCNLLWCRLRSEMRIRRPIISASRRNLLINVFPLKIVYRWWYFQIILDVAEDYYGRLSTAPLIFSAWGEQGVAFHQFCYFLSPLSLIWTIISNLSSLWLSLPFLSIFLEIRGVDVCGMHKLSLWFVLLLLLYCIMEVRDSLFINEVFIQMLIIVQDLMSCAKPVCDIFPGINPFFSFSLVEYRA